MGEHSETRQHRGPPLGNVTLVRRALTHDCADHNEKDARGIFLKDVKEAFPELRSDLNAQYGLLLGNGHLPRLCPKLNCQGRQREDDKSVPDRKRHFVNGNAKLVNAFSLSILEDLDLGPAKGTPSWAYEYLPKTSRASYEQLRK